MKKQMIVKIFLMVFMVYILASCSPSNTINPISIDESLINQQILLRVPSFGNTFTTRDSILLELKYNSNNKITFPNDYNIRIFQKTKNGWIEIYEIPTTRIPSDDVIFSPLTNTSFVQPIYIHPDFPDPKQKCSIRIYVFGQMETEEGVKEVAAYTEVILKP